MQAILVSTDLLTPSRLAGIAESLGYQFSIAPNLEHLQTQLQEEIPQLVIVDLSATPVDIKTVISAAEATEPPRPVIAFGPHVHERALAVAKQAGCSEVFTQGQFHRKSAEILTQYLGCDSAS